MPQYVTTSADYWIASTAITITLNALGEPNRTQGSVVSGAVIMLLREDITAGGDNGDGLGYGANHEPKRWPLSLSPTYFNSDTAKYVYVAVPRSSTVGTQAVVVFPSEQLDIYGRSMTTPADSQSTAKPGDDDFVGRQVGSTDYFYVWLQAIISEVKTLESGQRGREWVGGKKPESGKLSTSQGMKDKMNEGEWYSWSSVTQVVTFLKEIVMDAGSKFRNLKAVVATIEQELVSKGKALFEGDVVVNGQLTAYNAVMNTIRSSNYTGDGMADSGWLITNDYAGSSRAVFDYLYIRKKAVFESLEIKELQFTSGDLAQSLASATLERTDYLEVDEQGNVTLLGYSVQKIPWTLKGFLMRLSGMKPYALARTKRIRITLKPEDLLRVNRIRCYFLAKDDDKKIYNLWKENDLARCQTFNIDNIDRETYAGETHKAGNVFWWRLVKGYSTEAVTIDGKEYHYFDVAYGYTEEQEANRTGVRTAWCDLLSDLPAAGDKVVQFGNTSDPARMNIIVSEVNGEGNVDAPAVKSYRGVHTFNTDDDWWGGESCRKMMLSPSSGVEFYAPSFKFITEYGIERPQIERGAWLSIPFEEDKEHQTFPDYSDDVLDENGNFVSRSDGNPKKYIRKCRYYDRVEHKGSTWLCTIAESHYWRKYDNGVWSKITDAQYQSLPQEEKNKCEEVRNYTTDEPSKASNDWTISAEKGEKGTGIKTVKSYYAKTAEALVMPRDDGSVTWQESLSALGDIKEGWYVWTKNVTTYTDTLASTTTYTVSRWGIDGDGIHNIETKFYEDSRLLSQSQLADLAESSWVEYASLSLTKGDYIYTRIKITYDKNQTPTISYTVNRIGEDGVSYITTEEYYCLGDSRTTPPAKHPYTRTDGKPEKMTPAVMQSRMNGGAWRESRPDYDTSTAESRAKKYLWNFEVGYDTTAEVQVTQPMCVGNYEKGIQSIVELYAISAYAVAPQQGGYPQDITAWTDEAHDCAPTDAKPYQWNKTVTTYSDGSQDVFYHVSAVKGTKGKDGTSPWIADLSNEMDSVACDLNGNPTAVKILTTTIALFYGQTAKDFGTPTVKRNGTAYSVNASSFVNGVRVTYSNKVLTVAYNTSAVISNTDEYEITITASDDSTVVRTLTFSVLGARPGADGEAATTYQLVPSASEIVRRKDGSYSPASLTCYCTSLKAGTATDNPSEATMQYSYNGSNWTTFTGSTSFAAPDIYAQPSKKLYLRLLVDGKVMDKETIPVVEDGENGPKGDKGDDGDDGYGLSLTPTSLILESVLNGNQEVVNYVNNVVTVRVMKGSTPVSLTCSILTGTDSHSSNISISDSNIPVNNAGTYSTVTLAGGINLNNANKDESGFFTVSVSSNDNKFSQNVRINFYVNRAATFTRQIKNGIEKAMGAQDEYSYDKLGNVIQKAYQTEIQTSAKGLTQKFTEQVSRAGADERNLFGFSNEIVFDKAIPFIQGYGLIGRPWLNTSDKTARIYNLGMYGRLGYYTVSCQVRTSASNGYVRLQMNWHEATSGTQAVSDGISGCVYANTSQWKTLEATFLFDNAAEAHIGTSLQAGEAGSYSSGDINGYIDIGQVNSGTDATRKSVSDNLVYVRHLKIEYRDFASDFCESDEDIAAIGQGDIIPEWDYHNMSYAPSVIINGATYPDYYYQTIDWNAGTSFWCLSKSGLPFSVKAGKIYTLSYWARTSNAGMVIRNHLYNQDNPQVRIIDINIDGIYDAGAVGTIIESAVSDGRTGVRLSTTWKQYFVRFYVTRDISNMNCYACVIWREDNEIRNSSGVVTGYRSGTIYFADVRLQEGYVMDASSFSSLIEQNARRISLVQQSGTKRAGVDIQNGTINLYGDRVTFSNADGTVKDKVWIDPATGAIHAVDGDFDGEITATSGTIGGFTIDDTRLYNSNWEAGIDISYDEGGKVVRIGKNAKGESFGENAIIRAENTKALGGSYNTALYLNASGATNNYAFYGKGNGVLDGYMQGFKVHAITNLGKVSNPYQINLRNGMVQAIVSVGINEDKFLRLPTLGEIKQTLGINANATTNFTCQLVLINQSAIQSTSHNRDNVWVKGSSHNYSDLITSPYAIPRILRSNESEDVGLPNANMLIFHITYLNQHFIANYILG